MTRRLPQVYVLVALVVSTALCVLTPPFGVPDESGHARRSIEIAHREIVPEETEEGVGGALDVNFLVLADAMDGIRNRFTALHHTEKRLPDGRVTAAELAPLRTLRWSHRTKFSDFRNTAVYSPVLYLPQAIGWGIGEAADLTIMRSLLLARLLAAWCAVTIGWLALRLCGQGRWLLFVYLLLPTELSLMSSCSQDALLMPVAGLTMVLLWRAVSARRMLTAVEMTVVACLMAVCVTARIPYLPMMLALLLPALEAEGEGRKRLMTTGLGVALALAAVGGWQMVVRGLGTLIGPTARPALQVAFLRAHPMAGAASLLYAIFVQVPVSVVKGMYLLGCNDVVPPPALRLMLMAGAGVVALLTAGSGVRSRAGRAVLALALLGTVSAIWLAEYLIWTPPGAMQVLGLQTRYFLPLLPFLFLLCPRRWAAAARCWLDAGQGKVEAGLLAGAGIFVATVMYAPWTAAHVFYRTGLMSALSLGLER